MKSSMLKYKWMCVAVFCCAMFAACEPTEVASDQNPISFNNGPARAQEVLASAANARIWAYYTKTNATPNWVWTGEKAQLATDDDGNFEFTVNGNTKYWDNGTYNFYSIYSEDFKNNNGTIATYTENDNKLTFTYSIANQKELRLATATNLEAANNHSEPVPFQFNHILSRIKFRGSSSIEDMPIQMTKFIVTATKTAEYAIATNVTCTPATAAETIELPYADGVNVVEKEDGFKYKDGTEVLDGAGNKITSLKYTVLPYKAALADGKVLKKIDVTEEPAKETDEDYGWLVFPTSADKISIKVEYVDNQGIITQKTATLPSTELEMGKSYIFQFSIQPAGPIVFDNEVIINDWETETEAGDVQF